MILDELLEFCTDEHRIYPTPRQWHEFWKMLPNREFQGDGWQPHLPLILAAWWESSDSSKRARLKEHLDWASSNGVLEQVADFLKGLSDDEWHYETMREKK